MAASRRRPGLTRAEYFRYIEHYHGTVARLERFKITRYIQNHVIDGAFGVLSDADHKNRATDREGVVELYFDEFRLSLIHISEPTRRTPISYAVFCLQKKIVRGL